MIITEEKKDQGMINFFGHPEAVEEFKNLTDNDEMIQYMWKMPKVQVLKIQAQKLV